MPTVDKTTAALIDTSRQDRTAKRTLTHKHTGLQGGSSPRPQAALYEAPLPSGKQFRQLPNMVLRPNPNEA